MKKLSAGTAHRIPADVRTVVVSSSRLHELWEGLTPLARNEWICWIISPKKPETREKHIKRFQHDLLTGKRRPCCWAGCPHR